jgi:hypothetical protein
MMVPEGRRTDVPVHGEGRRNPTQIVHANGILGYVITLS